MKGIKEFGVLEIGAIIAGWLVLNKLLKAKVAVIAENKNDVPLPVIGVDAAPDDSKITFDTVNNPSLNTVVYNPGATAPAPTLSAAVMPQNFIGMPIEKQGELNPTLSPINTSNDYYDYVPFEEQRYKRVPAVEQPMYTDEYFRS